MAEVSALALQKLMAWLSPSFPVGAYTYSHGLEWAIEDGTVTTRHDLETWIADLLRHGAGRADAVLFCAAWRATAAGDTERLRHVAELGTAFQPSRERHLEATAQGRAFLTAVTAAWRSPKLTGLAWSPDPVPYSVAVAAAASGHDVPLAQALAAFLAAFVANLVSAGVRAIPIGQTDGQRIVAALAPLIIEIAAAAEQASPDDLGGAALRADIASMKHETQYTRLFRS